MKLFTVSYKLETWYDCKDCGPNDCGTILLSESYTAAKYNSQNRNSDRSNTE